VSADQLAPVESPALDRGAVHDLTLEARSLLTGEVRQLLEGVYGLHLNGSFAPTDQLLAMQTVPEVAETRGRLERHLADEVAAGLGETEAVEKLIKEVAFTHLNRLVALKMLEARRLIRGTIDKYQDSNAFKFYLVDHSDDMAAYEAGSLPQNAAGDGPRDIAYRHFLLWQYGQLAQEIGVLFDPDNLPSRLFPRPAALKQLIDMLNAPGLSGSWAPGSEETIGWVYQYFNEEEKAQVFERLFKQKLKIRREDIPAATELFTPSWIVRWIVHNTLGRMWVQMHPDSSLTQSLDYLVPLAGDVPREALKPAKDIEILDPACGTMHFGLVAFDLLVQMYGEEIARAGESGWPERPSVEREEDIPATIIARNLFGIDIDLRAVQLSALALYLKAKSYNKDAIISASNLACADVVPLDGNRLEAFLRRMQFSRPIYERLIRALWARLKDAGLVGSLLRLEEEVQSLVEQERQRYQREGLGRLPFAEVRDAFEDRGDEDDFWGILEEQIVQAFDEFAREQAAAGDDQTYFAGEATKGMRLLDLMRRRYDLVVTNPPYLSDRSMNAPLLAFMKAAYPSSKGDLYAAFIERCSGFLNERGRLGMIAQQSFMFISSYEKLRKGLLQHQAIEAMCHVGPRAFAEISGEKVNTTVFALRREAGDYSRANAIGTYFRLVKEPDAEAKQRGFERGLSSLRSGRLDSDVYRYRQGDIDAIGGSPWVYWITSGLRRLFHALPSLSTVAPPKMGMGTRNNARFLRYWWELGIGRVTRTCMSVEESVASGRRWFPYMKGGEFRRWYGNQEYVVNYFEGGRELKAEQIQKYPYIGNNTGWIVPNESFYFHRGVTWSDLTSGRFSARLSPGGFIFDVKGSSAFPSDISLVLAILNSSIAHYALSLLNPTVSFQVGDLARLPIPADRNPELAPRVEQAVSLARQDGVEDETTYDFVCPLEWECGPEVVATRMSMLSSTEARIDEAIYRLYDIASDDRSAIERELSEPPGDSDRNAPEAAEGELHGEYPGAVSREEVAARWVSYAVGIALGRFDVGAENGLGVLLRRDQ
jgi:N-6 DNA Methylase